LLIAQGAHPKAIQTRLGHSSIVVTMDTYGHLLEGLDADLAEKLQTMAAAQPNQAAANAS
jgi:integrase